uniref:Uncharacterized protein n=1 Tax=Rhizophora mucronata TaxID=61149 RepID=A0A2P2NS80_RHIMU
MAPKQQKKMRLISLCQHRNQKAQHNQLHWFPRKRITRLQLQLKTLSSRWWKLQSMTIHQLFLHLR